MIKNMTKSKAIIILIVMLLALAGITYVDIAGVDASGRGSASDIKLGLDLAGGVSITYQVVGEEEPSPTDMADTISKLQQRVWNYSTEAVVYQEGSDRINIEIPGVSDANAILQELGRPGALYFIKQTGSDGMDNYSSQLVMTEDGSYGYEHSLNRSLEEIIADGGVVLEGTDVMDAEAATRTDNMQNQQIVVVLTLTPEGTAKFEEATREAYNGGVNSKSIAIYYDGNFVSVPTVSAVITDGSAQISGSKNFEEAEKLASTIRIGGLSLELEELHSKVVGAQLGVDAIETSLKAGAIGLVIVIIFMIAVYFISGLAASLALGIVLSMFTALVLTKLIMSALYTLGLKDAKWYGIGRERKPLNILKHKKWFFGISSALIVAGFVVMGVYMGTTGDALNLSLEFKGGTATTVIFAESKTLEQVNSEIVPYVEEITGSSVQIQTVQGSSEIIFKSDSLDKDQREQLNQMFREQFGVTAEIGSETISSTISDEMTRDTIIAVIVAIVCMLIYIRIRFSDIRFGASGVLALLHDVLVVLAFYAVARVSVSNTFIACMLTIVGYSINATIVIFDRVRENMAEMGKKESLEDVLNRSITQTLSRSIFTSLTTFIMVAVLYILGVTSIRDFALPLMVGILCGAYSSVCLAGPVWYVLRTKFPPKAKAGK